MQQGLAISNDKTVSNYLLEGAEIAKRAYEEAVVSSVSSIKEIDNAMSGKDFVPVSYEGLAAKAYTSQKDLQLENINLEKDKLENQHEVWMNQEREKRGRLEGYLKAKLYSSGAQDSSAALTTMALVVNATDLRIQLKEGDYQYSMSKLNLESRNIMVDYTKKIVKLGMDSKNSISVAKKEFDDKLRVIDGKIIEDNKEKQKMKYSVLETFTE